MPHEPIERPRTADPSLWNPDLAPTTPSQRTWGKWHIAALWVGMAVCIPTYTLAAGLMASGMSWLGATLTVFFGNVIVLVPMILNAHPGAKYGIPFPVLARSSFGVRGANIPAVLRALVACGWFGIQTWFGGLAVYELIRALLPAIGDAPDLGAFLGLNLAQLLCFLGFWALQMYFVVRGMESIKFLETWSAPVLIAVGLALLIWGFSAGGGPGRVLDASEQFNRPAAVAFVQNGEVHGIDVTVVTVDGKPKATEMRHAPVARDAKPADIDAALAAAPWVPFAPRIQIGPDKEGVRYFVEVRSPAKLEGSRAEMSMPNPNGGSLGSLLVGLTAMVGFWATLSLNIPDFTRFAKSQKDQVQGQAIGLPATMLLYSFVGIAVTSASLLVFDDVILASDAPWDPVALIARFDNPAVVIFAMFALIIATLTTNIAANVVSPANDFANLAPSKISFKLGGIITGVLGIVIMPWKLLASVGDYLFVWLVGYSALLGPIGGIMVADYFIVRKKTLDVDGLYQKDGPYTFSRGINWRAVLVLLLAVAPNLPGFLAAAGVLDKGTVPDVFHEIYNYAWFVGFGLGFLLYWAFGVPRRASGPAAGTSP